MFLEMMNILVGIFWFLMAVIVVGIILIVIFG